MLGIDMGDHTGTESCVGLMKGGWGRCGAGGKKDEQRGIRREYPPPIRCLARTESSHLGWVMKRYYTSDGRLIIREEKSPNFDFLRAHRSNGRLTLQLVPMTQNADNDFSVEVEEERENVKAEEDDDMNRVTGGGGGGGGGETVVSGGGVGGNTCYNYETVRSSSCLYVVQVPAM